MLTCEFFIFFQELCKAASITLDNKTVLIEKAVHELIDLLLDWGDAEIPEDTLSPLPVPPTAASARRASVSFIPKSPGDLTKFRRRMLRQEMVTEGDFLIEHFTRQNLDALVKVTRHTLETIKKRLSSSTALGYETLKDFRKSQSPVFSAKVVLAIPSIIMKPSLEDIQNTISAVIQTILGVHKQVYMWDEDRSLLNPPPQDATQSHILNRHSKPNVEAPPKQLKNFYRLVSENKEVAKLVSLLSTTVTSSKKLVMDALGQFNKFQELWTVDRDEKLKGFAATKPLLSDYEIEIRKYERQEGLIMEEPDAVIAGAIALQTGWLVVFIFHTESRFILIFENVICQLSRDSLSTDLKIQ